jgi:hypothetical protein
MSGFFIFVSLLLHVTAFYFLFILWKKTENQKGKENTSSTDEMIELLEHFSEEIKDENDRLHNLIKRYALDMQEIKEGYAKNSTEAPVLVDDKPSEEEQDAKGQDQQTEEVLQLARKGYTANEIAKMLNRGKGEIELLLKFYA